MPEYINRQDLIKFLDNIQQPKMPITEGFKFITIDDTIRVVSERPTADVIERSKIDKTIEDIKELYTEWENLSDDARLETNPFGAVLNILQRNIGE